MIKPSGASAGTPPDTSRPPTEPAGENGNLPPVLINRITDRNISIAHKPKHRKE